MGGSLRNAGSPETDMDVHLIAIVGGSGSGKSWLADRLAEQFGANAGRIALDDFYRCRAHLPPADRSRVNFDDPAAMDWTLFGRTLARLRAGEPVELPEYDFVAHVRRPVTRPWHPRRLVLVEGLWLLHEARLRPLYSLSVFIDCTEALRLARRQERDQRERGRSAEEVHAQFLRDVAPMHRRYVEPQRQHADLVVSLDSGSAAMAEVGAVVGRLVERGGAVR